MKKPIALASGIRPNAVLCCCAAVLLSACGAGVSDPVNGLQSETAVELGSGTARTAPNNASATPYGVDAAPGTTDAATPAMPAAGPVTSAAAVAAAPRGTAVAAATATNIEPAYDSKRQSASTAGFSDQAETPVEGAQEVAQESAPAGCGTAGCQH